METVNIKLKTVSEIKCSIEIDDQVQNILNDQVPSIAFEQLLNADSQKKEISLTFTVKYSLEEHNILESQYRFVFEVKEFDDYIHIEKTGIKVHNNLMPHFLSVEIGTMRGILIVKTAGTPLSKFLIPMLNPYEVLDHMEKK